MTVSTLPTPLTEAEFYQRLKDDPIAFIKLCWPHTTLYDKQREILYSLRDNDETFVPAGNQLGKDFISGLGVLWFFMSRHPCRVVTTSVDATQLNAVLWGEIRRFLQTSVHPLVSTQPGGVIVVNDLRLKKIVNGKTCGISYVIGKVVGDTSEGLLGHHAYPEIPDNLPHSLFVADEASGLADECIDMANKWANRKLIIGNPFECSNFFKYAVKGRPGTEDRGGDLLKPDGKTYYRRVIEISAEDSPNVRYGLAQERLGIEPDNTVLVSGVKTYSDYKKHRKFWDPIQQCIGLDGKFYEGAEVLLFPPLWLNRAATKANQIPFMNRKGIAIGVDSAMGGDNTAYAIVDDAGLIELISMKTKDTSVVVKRVLALMLQYGVQAENVLFDAGGGGYQHADFMRDKGHNVRTVAFGESATPDLKRRTVTPLADRVEAKEVKYIYKNRRAEMYGELRCLINPDLNEKGFGIPAKYYELRRQLAPIPLDWDKEGRLVLPPKNKPDKNSKIVTLTQMLGCSPDEADALVLAVFGLVNRKKPVIAGKAF